MFRSAVIIVLAGAVVTAAFMAGRYSARLAPFSPAARTELNTLVHDYIVQNPEVLNEGIAALQAKEERAHQAKLKDAVAAHSKELLASAEGTVMGNPDGDVTLVEFFDYNCPYCKAIFPSLMETIKSDGKVRLVLKEFPILGPSSITASRAALAAVKQGKYAAFHTAMMNHKGALTDDVVMQVAKDTGLDVAQLQADMKAPEIEDTLHKVQGLAGDLEVEGTPSMLINDTIIQKTVDTVEKDELKGLIAKARAKS